MPAIAAPPPRFTVTEAATAMSVDRRTFYRHGWNHIFTRFRAGKQLRVCKLELDEALALLVGEDADGGQARAKSAVLRKRKELGRLP
ncbi:hypothetical protein J0H58_28240 [bacterium]|nr:hypothetical protein [bacterium]